MRVRLPPLGVFVCESICALGTWSRLSRRHHVGFLRIGSSEAWTLPCGQLGLWRIPDHCPTWVGLRVTLWRPPGLCSQPSMGACAPTHFSFGVVSPTSWAFNSCTHGMMETEVEKGDAHPQLPFPPGCFGGRRKAGNCSRGSPASLDPSLLLLTPEAFSQPSLLEAAGGLWCPGQLLFPCASGELSHPCQWQSPKPPWSAGHWEREQAKVEGMERAGG